MQQAMQHAMSMSTDKRQRNAACKMQLRIANLSDAVYSAKESIVPRLHQLLSQLYSRQQSMMHVQQVMHVVLPVSAWTQTLHEHKRCMNKGAEESMDISGFQEAGYFIAWIFPLWLVAERVCKCSPRFFFHKVCKCEYASAAHGACLFTFCFE